MPHINAQIIFPLLILAALIILGVWAPGYFSDMFNFDFSGNADYTANKVSFMDLAIPKISSIVFWLSAIVLGIITMVKKYSLIPLMGVTTCLYLLTGMTKSNWAWFLGWLLLGLIIYIFYGYKKADSPMPDDFRAVWDRLAGKYCNDTVLTARFFDEITKKYTTTRRHYHNLQHIQNAFGILRQPYAGQLIDIDVVAFSVFYHDIIYNVLRKDNEPRSAGLAVKRLKALSVPPEKAEQVRLFYRGYANPCHYSFSYPTQAICNYSLILIWSILGPIGRHMKPIPNRVRREYRIYPDKVYYPGRKQFFQHCLLTGHIFQTLFSVTGIEARARRIWCRNWQKCLSEEG